MKMLLMGGTGTLSSDTTRLCIDKGYEVYLFNRGNRNTFEGNNVHYLIGDVNDNDSFIAAIQNEKFDVVIDYLVYNLEALKRRVALYSNITKQFIFISSATIFPVTSNIINESTARGNDGWDYAKDKLLCEEYLEANRESLGFKYTIVRPYVTYDKRRIPFTIISKRYCWNLMNRINEGLPILMCGDGCQKVTLTSTTDFAKGITGLFLNEKAYNTDFNLVGDAVATWNDVIKITERFLNKKATVIYVDTIIVANEIPSIREELLYDKAQSHVFDNSKLKHAVPDFSTDINLEQGLTQTLRFLSETPSLQVIDGDWNIMVNLLCNRFANTGIKVSLQDKMRYIIKENRVLMIAKREVRKVLRKLR